MAHYWNNTENEDHQAELDELRWMDRARKRLESQRLTNEFEGYFGGPPEKEDEEGDEM